MNDKKYYNVGIYLRLSNEDRNKINKDETSESIKNQRNMLIDYINKHNEFKLACEYCDEDLSGAGTYRPEFERLIKDCEDGKLDVVLCKSQSRFSRDMEIVEKYINNKFREWNIRFIGLSDNADTNNYGNKKARQINGLVNEWYLEDVSNNIRSAFNSKMRHGEFISPFAPFGYVVSNINNNKLEIDYEASLVVKKIYNLYLNGYGFTKIASYLNNHNVMCPSLYKYKKGCKLNIVSNKSRDEIKWNSNAIKNILTNEVYIGSLVQGKRTTVSYKNKKIIKKNKSKWINVKNTHEAIIDEDVFKRVQLAIINKAKPIKKSGIIHIFSGKVFCFKCKHIMRKKNSSKHEYLVCSNSCNNKSIRYDYLEDIVLKEINKLVKEFIDVHMINEIIKTNNIRSNVLNELYLKKINLEKELVRNKDYIKNLYIDKVNNIIDNQHFNYLIDSFNKDENDIKNELKVLNDKIDNYKNECIFINNGWCVNKLNRFITNLFVDKIYIDNKEKVIEIKWKCL